MVVYLHADFFYISNNTPEISVIGTVAITGSTVEIDKPNKDTVPGASCTDLSQSEVDKQASLERNDNEDFGKTLQTSETSGVNDPCKEDETFTFDTRPLGGRTMEDADKGLQSFPVLQACKMLVLLFGHILIIDLLFTPINLSRICLLIKYPILLPWDFAEARRRIPCSIC